VLLDFSARQADFMEMWPIWHSQVIYSPKNFVHVPKIHLFLGPAVLGQTCAYRAWDFTVCFYTFFTYGSFSKFSQT